MVRAGSVFHMTTSVVRPGPLDPVLATAAFGVSFLLAWLIRATIGFRVDAEVEGIDEAEHAETSTTTRP